MVCEQGWVDVLAHMLDHGLNPNVVHEPGANPTVDMDSVYPLACIEQVNTIEMVDLLIKRGADPNFGCALHNSVDNPLLLQCLIDRGGNPSHEKEGFSLLMVWLAMAHSQPKHAIPTLMKSFDVLFNAGVDLSLPVKQGRSFLNDCWTARNLREFIPYFIEKGANPYQPGTGRGNDRLSLLDLLEKKVKTKPGAHPGDALLAQLRAARLDQDTPTSPATRSPPRL